MTSNPPNETALFMSTEASERISHTIPFDVFWGWLQSHRNCILRAGTPYAILLDHEEFHWDILQEDGGTEVVQLLRGKELVGEMVILSSDIAYVQASPGESDSHMFECIVETPESREVLYHFVLSHGFVEDAPTGRRWTH